MSLVIQWSTEDTSESSGVFTASFSEHELRFDAVVQETHSFESLVTEHAVEGAAAISDHKRPNPRRLSLEVVVTNTPVTDVLPSGYESFRPPQTITQPNGKNVLVQSFTDTFDRVGDVFNTLKRLASEPTLVTVITSTGLDVYENMSVVSVIAPRDPLSGGSISFNIELVEIRLAQISLVDSPTPQEVRGASSEDSGNQETEDATAEESENRSLAADITDRFNAGQSAEQIARGIMGFE